MHSVFNKLIYIQMQLIRKMRTIWFLAIVVLIVTISSNNIYGNTYYTSDNYLDGFESNYGGQWIQEVENNEEKSNLEPIRYNAAIGTRPSSGIKIYTPGFGFALQSDVDYWFFPSLDSSNIDDPSLLIYFNIFVYTLNPKNGTWVELLFETSEGDFEGIVQVVIPQNQLEETIVVSKNELTGVGLVETFAKNLYAVWKNPETLGEFPANHAYKNESGDVLIKNFEQGQTSIVNATSTNLTEEFSWRLAKYKISLSFNFFDKSSNIIDNDMFLRIFSPLGLMYSYEVLYYLSGKEFTGTLLTAIPWPVYFGIAILVSAVSIVIMKRLRPVKA